MSDAIEPTSVQTGAEAAAGDNTPVPANRGAVDRPTWAGAIHGILNFVTLVARITALAIAAALLKEQLHLLKALMHQVAAWARRLADHLAQAGDDLDATRDTLQGMLETYSNEVQERLTIVATIFLPLTVVTSFFGQNFAWLINHIGSAWAFWGLGIGGLLISSCAIVVWLIRSGLYHGPKP